MNSARNNQESVQTLSQTERHQDDDLDIWMLLSVVRRRAPLIIGLTVAIVVVTGFVVLGITPRYSSEARILIENGESAFARPEGELAQPEARYADPAAVLSQVQVLLSRNLAEQVSSKTGLAEVDEFSGQGRRLPLHKRLMAMIGLGGEKVLANDERVIDTYYDRLSVHQIETSRVISVRFTSEDAALAALVSNEVADGYVAGNRVAKYSSDQDAAKWLKGEIDDLRVKVAEAEQAVEDFRAGKGLLQSGRDISLNQQQLGEINTKLISVRAQETEARARAQLVKRLIKQPGGLDAAADVLKSRLIQRLRELQAAQSRDFAELSASLLPKHPRMRQLQAKRADIERRIRNEISKIARGLENEADIAAARVAELKITLESFKTEATDAKTAEVQLRALERESKAQRDLLESFMRRFRQASARNDVASHSANARIISRAVVASQPSYPATGGILALTSVAALLLSFVMAFFVEFLSPKGARVPRQQTAQRFDEPDLASAIPEHRLGAISGAPSVDMASLYPMREAAEQMDTGVTAFAPPSATQAISEAHAKSMAGAAKSIVHLVGGRKLRRLAVVDVAGTPGGIATVLAAGRGIAEAGQRTVIVEANDAGSLATLAGLEPAAGLSNILSGRSGLMEVLCASGTDGLALLLGGDSPIGTSPDTFGRVSQVISALETRFDVVIVLSGEITPVSLQIASGCHMTLLNISADHIGLPDFQMSVDQLKTFGVEDAVVVSTGPSQIELFEAFSSKKPLPDVA